MKDHVKILLFVLVLSAFAYAAGAPAMIGGQGVSNPVPEINWNS